jgi:hypothetical protein
MAIFDAVAELAMPGWIKWVGWILVIGLIAGAFYYQTSVISSKDEKIIKLSKEARGAEASLQFMAQEYVGVVEQNRQNADRFEAYKSEQKEIMKAVHQSHIAEVERLKRENKILARIRNAKKEDDGPIAPVLLDTFEWMRNEADRVPAAPDHNQSSRA